MTMTVTGTHNDEAPHDDGDGCSSDEEGDPPDPAGQRIAAASSSSAVRSSVWFGPEGSESLERELVAFLGTHNGVAVLQWPRDLDRSSRLSAVGIPCLWFADNVPDTVPVRRGLHDWLPRTATTEELHGRLERLSQAAMAQRAAARLTLTTDGHLKLGECDVPLASGLRRPAAILIAHFGEAVDDRVLSGGLSEVGTSWKGPLVSQLLHLDQCINPLGLEVVPLADHRHLIRRCRL